MSQPTGYPYEGAAHRAVDADASKLHAEREQSRKPKPSYLPHDARPNPPPPQPEKSPRELAQSIVDALGSDALAIVDVMAHVLLITGISGFAVYKRMSEIEYHNHLTREERNGNT